MIQAESGSLKLVATAGFNRLNVLAYFRAEAPPLLLVLLPCRPSLALSFDDDDDDDVYSFVGGGLFGR